MGKKHSTEEQVAFELSQAESGTSAASIIRKLGISEQTFYRWKQRFAGLGIAELRRLRTLDFSRPGKPTDSDACSGGRDAEFGRRIR